MSEDHSRAADDLVNGLHGVQVAVVARRLRARLVATVDDDKLRLIIQQELQRFSGSAAVSESQATRLWADSSR